MREGLPKMVGTITTGRGSKMGQMILAIDRKIGPFSLLDIEREFPGISRDMNRHILRKMRDDGLIRSMGTGRGAKWVKVQGKGGENYD